MNLKRKFFYFLWKIETKVLDCLEINDKIARYNLFWIEDLDEFLMERFSCR